MKHTTHTLFYFFLLTLTFSFTANAQTELWSMTSDGGQYGNGTIFHIRPDGSSYTKCFEFPDTIINGADPFYGTPVLATNGKLYAMTAHGGFYHKGIIFMVDTATNTTTSLYSFVGTDGSNPTGNLIQASDGNLYGTTSIGGTNNFGVLFKYNPVSNVYTKLFDFSSSNGREPNGGVIQASNGILYGMTKFGGTGNYGIIYSFNLITNTLTKLFDFTIALGGQPYGNLMQAANGKLYGLTFIGGANSQGNIFSYDIGTSTYASRFDFSSATTGRSPYGALIQLPSGLLYGTTSAGGGSSFGTLFSFDDAIASFSIVHNFASGSADGMTPFCTLLLGSDGKLYGTTSVGTSSVGTIFSCTTGGTYTRLTSLLSTTAGSTPKGGLLQAVPGGKLFGMTSLGGSGNGTFFNFNITGSVFTKNFDFGFKPKGSFPSASLIKANDGKLYGLTTNGGINNSGGVLFSFIPSTNTYAKLFDLGSNCNPTGSVMQASNGILYGLTNGGGTSGQGSMFSYNTGTSTFTTLVNLNSNGRVPQGSIIQASNGKLYGMTGYGGAADFGTIFTYDIGTATYTKLFEFTGAATGKRPYGSLVEASNGKLYGMTFLGGTTDDGTVFTYDPATSVQTKIVDFTGANGFGPFGTLIQATNGLLYGTTEIGGANNGGEIFSIDPATNALTIVYSFPLFTAAGTALGNSPQSSLKQGLDGKLYGMTSDGGTNNDGVIYSYDIGTSTYTVLRDLNFPDGIKPFFNDFIELGISLLTGSVSTNICAGTAMNVSYTVSSSLTAGNVFTAQLSNSSGSFASPTTIGTLSSVNSGTIACVIPSGTATGSGYRIRVVSSTPALTGTDNGSNISISPFKGIFFTETMGTTGASIAISTHESANGFDNDGFTMTGTGQVENTTPSSGYATASGSANIFLTNIAGRFFQIEGINTTGLTGLELSFGIYKNTIASGDNPVLEMSTDGSTYLPVSYPALPSGAGTNIWHYRTATGVIPSTANLRIRWRHNVGPVNQYRIDDIKLNFINPTAGITVSGSSTICNGSTVSLLASTTTSYLWSNSATTQGIVTSTAGNYFCTLTSENGCALLSNTITVTDFTPSLFTVTGGGNYCSTASGVLVGLSGSESGISYQLIRDVVNNVGAPMIGNGSAISFGLQTTAGTYTVVATNLSGPCTRAMTGSVAVSVTAATTYFADGDVDTYGNPSVSQLACVAPPGYVLNNTDCNDGSASVHPGAAEIVGNGIDEDCNAQELCYTDVDNDNYGTNVTIASANLVCTDFNEAPVNGDCNDNAASINPGATEVVGDGIDQNCNGQELCYTDVDNDNFGTNVTIASANLVCTDFNEAPVNGDCNDNNASAYPGATEIVGDGVDEDCNGQEICYTDIDNDNFGTNVTLVSANLSCADLNEAPGNGDCNDNNGAVYPGATEVCCNLIDDDCDSQVDENCALAAGVYCIGPAVSYSPPSGPAYINGSNPFDHITDAVIYLNAHGTCGNVIFELQNDFTSIGETFPITITYSGTPTSTATFRPRSNASTNLSINCTVSAANMIVFDGADYVTFDGSPGGVMDSICKINVTNNSPSVNAGTNFLFRNNTTHCTINALNIDGGTGADYCIQIGDATSTNGNSFLTINNCYIGCVNIAQPADTAIRCRDGNSGSITNSDITITNNKIHDILDGVVVLFPSSSGNWNISSNHFYVTTNKALQISEPIIFNSNGPTLASISGNYIGGMAPYCGGSLMTDNSGLGIIGINVDIKNSIGISTVNANAIMNIQRDGSSLQSFVGIYVNDGNIDVLNNIIGKVGSGGGLFFNSPCSFTGISYHSNVTNNACEVKGNKLNNILMINSVNPNYGFIGIYYDHTFVVFVQGISNNTIANIDYYGMNSFVGIYIRGSTNITPSALDVYDNKMENLKCWASTGCTFKGIYTETGNISLFRNRIGNFNVVNDIWALANQTHYGIHCVQNGNISILNDTVCDITFGTSGNAKFTAISINTFGGSNTTTVSHCVIKDIRTSSIKSGTEFDASADFALTGIYVGSGGNTQVDFNTVRDLAALTTSAVNPIISGVSILSAGPTDVFGNVIISSLNTATNTSTFPAIIGLFVSNSSTCTSFNNMISLDNNGSNTGMKVFGIYDKSVSATNKYHFNSVQVFGNSTFIANSSAFHLRSNTVALELRDNIFSNLRTGSGKNYAVVNEIGSAVSWTSSTSNYNDLFSQNASTLGAWPSGTDKTFATWKTISGGDANSKNVVPSFVANYDLHLTPTSNCQLNGTGTPGVTVIDIDNQSRHATAPDMGADESNGNGFPGATGPITGTSPVCKGQNGVPYSIAAVVNASGYTWSLPFGASIATGTNTNAITVNFSASATSGNITVTPTSICGSGTASLPFAVTVNTCSLTYNLKLFLEGFYTGGGLMDNAGLGGCLYMYGATGDPTIVDTVSVSLMHPFSFALIETKKAILKTNGSVSVSFSNAIVSGSSYYIKINHRNTIETWSNAPVVVTNGGLYDFTTNLSKAYGNNMKQVFDMFKFAFYSGDISDAGSATVGVQDRIIESQDYSDMENAVSVTLLGYKFEDITGDNVVESADYGLMENNVYFTIVTMRP